MGGMEVHLKSISLSARWEKTGQSFSLSSCSCSIAPLSSVYLLLLLGLIYQTVGSDVIRIGEFNMNILLIIGSLP